MLPFCVTVTPAGTVNQPPRFGGPATQSVPVGTAVRSLTGTDPEGGEVSFTLDGGAVLPSGVGALRPDGSFAGTPDTPGTWSFRVVLADPQGATFGVLMSNAYDD